MDREDKDIPPTSVENEDTPLLSKKGPTDSQAIKQKKHDSESLRGEHSAAAETLRANGREEPLPPPEAEMAKKRRGTEEEELAEAISSYEGMADIVSPAFGCGLVYGIWFCVCHCLASFLIQFSLHTLLLSLPISIGFMGARYMNECPMDVRLPYFMMVVGGMGTLVLLVRLALLLHTKFSTDDRLKKWLKKARILVEIFFLLFLILEVVFAYEKSPSNDSFSPDYCNEKFYSFVCSINNVLISLVVVWIFLYFITGQRCVRRAVPP